MVTAPRVSSMFPAGCFAFCESYQTRWYGPRVRSGWRHITTQRLRKASDRSPCPTSVSTWSLTPIVTLSSVPSVRPRRCEPIALMSPRLECSISSVPSRIAAGASRLGCSVSISVSSQLARLPVNRVASRSLADLPCFAAAATLPAPSETAPLTAPVALRAASIALYATGRSRFFRPPRRRSMGASTPLAACSRGR